MSGFLDDYGVGDQRREKVVRWLVISAIVLTIAIIAGYFVLRTYPARSFTNQFLDALRRHEYQTAYKMWGCEQPCRDYSFNMFLEDWGPKSPFSDPSRAAVKKTRFCNTGVIVTLSSPTGRDIPLWYERSTATLGFSPWPVCVTRIPAPDAAPATK